MSQAPSPATIAVWTRLNRAAASVHGRVEAALKAAGLPALGWYDALWEIEKAGTGGIRPLALQTRLLLPQYGLSRLIDRLVAAGHVLRLACDEDGRGQMLTLTEAGRAIRARMWPVYAGALVEAVGHRLPARDMVLLARLLERLEPGGS